MVYSMRINHRLGISLLIHVSPTSPLHSRCFHRAVRHVRNIKTTDGEGSFFNAAEAEAYWLVF